MNVEPISAFASNLQVALFARCQRRLERPGVGIPVQGVPVMLVRQQRDAGAAIAGDREFAVRRYRQRRIHALGDKTPEALIRDGQVEQVLKYLEMLDAGALG